MADPSVPARELEQPVAALVTRETTA